MTFTDRLSAMTFSMRQQVKPASLSEELMTEIKQILSNLLIAGCAIYRQIFTPVWRRNMGKKYYQSNGLGETKWYNLKKSNETRSLRRVSFPLEGQNCRKSFPA